MVRPHAGQAIGLQLEPHRQQIGLTLGYALAGLLHLVRDAEQVLHVMADLVRDHVGLGEIALRPVALAELVEEGQVEIDLAVGRTVERPHLRLTDAAGAARGAGVQHHAGLAVLRPARLEDRPPGVLGVGQHHRHEARHLVFRRRARLPRLSGLDGRRRHHLGGVEHHARVDAEVHRDQGEHDGADADLAATAQPAPALPPSILDVSALPAVTKVHDRCSLHRSMIRS